MAKIHVKVLGALNRPFGRDELDYQAKPGACLEELLLELGYQKAHLRFIVPAIAGKRETLGYVLREGDELTLTLPTSGG